MFINSFSIKHIWKHIYDRDILLAELYLNPVAEFFISFRLCMHSFLYHLLKILFKKVLWTYISLGVGV